MRRILLAISAAIAVVSAVSTAPNHAQALPLSAAGGVNAAISDAGLVQEANYGYGRRWSYGNQGCGWRGCNWAPAYRYHYQPYYSYYQPYNYYRPYPFYRHHRYW